MKTVLSPDNPLGYTRGGYAWEKVPLEGEAHLDFGCYRGDFLEHLSRKTRRRLVGVDVCREAIAEGRSKRPGLELIHLADSGRLPFPDNAFDSISLLDVIEHIADQKRVLDELFRVLAPEGILIVTVPGQYLFSLMDAGNLKFRFPRLHRWVYCLTHSREQYETRYAANPDGLIGDVEAAKAWHEHFTREALAALLGRSGFEVVEYDGSGFFQRPIRLVSLPTARMKFLNKPLTRVYRLDARLFSSMNLFCVAKKCRK
jgi:ubiquinone/menaquinone biosynthesis C-methylase UbiE